MAMASRNILEQIHGAYRLMGEKARYRPAAPSDGMGSIVVPESELNLEQECREYAERWWAEEDKHSFFVGCCNFATRPATIFAIEAARCMCGGSDGNRNALKLLELAVKDLQAAMEKDKN
jgi:hypothetical protein